MQGKAWALRASWIVVGMLCANFATLIESTGILDTTDLTLVFCGTEILLITI